MVIEIRSEQPADVERIAKVTELAFRHAPHTCGREHLLVADLRSAGALTLSLVAVSEQRTVGHVAASPVTVSEAVGNWYGIGPISVLPECQRRRIGTQLMEAALAGLRAQGAQGCVLVGDPKFYTRFGFRSDPRLTVPNVPLEVSLSLRFRPSDDRGTVTFHPAFLRAMSEPGTGPKP